MIETVNCYERFILSGEHRCHIHCIQHGFHQKTKRVPTWVPRRWSAHKMLTFFFGRLAIVLTFSITIVIIIITIILVIIAVTDVFTKISCGPKTCWRLISWKRFPVSFGVMRFTLGGSSVFCFVSIALFHGSFVFWEISPLSVIHCHFLSDENTIIWVHFPPVVYCRVVSSFFGSENVGRSTMVQT